MTWHYNGDLFEDPQNYYGFVYEIENLTTGKKYIGRKYFTQAGYKTVKGKRKKIRKESNWLDYYGSNKTLQEDVDKYGKDNFKRTILKLCKSRGNVNYWEAKYQFELSVLESDDYYNDWISIKAHRKHIKEE